MDAPVELSRSLPILNQRGLHARAAAKLVKLVAGFDAEVTVCRDGTEVSGLSIMGLMMLAAGIGSTILVKAKGADAMAALDAIEKMVAEKFGED
ncbi:MAG: HPr family phosphocarrier protein [Alphaproteobacteria bacterium]|nr:HPr family phosphocarrier protein [Alphaproteobacteria bacterium]